MEVGKTENQTLYHGVLKYHCRICHLFCSLWLQQTSHPFWQSPLVDVFWEHLCQGDQSWGYLTSKCGASEFCHGSAPSTNGKHRSAGNQKFIQAYPNMYKPSAEWHPKNQTHIIVKQLTSRQNQVTIFAIDLKSPFHHFGTLGLLRLGCMIYMYEIDTVWVEHTQIPRNQR